MDTLYIVIPAYNERENIEQIVADWHSALLKVTGVETASRLVVVDDGSKDDTYTILQSLAKTYPLLVPLTKENGGHGAAVLYGYRYAISAGADYVFQTDSDGQTNPKEFAAFWEKRKDFDAIFGNRTKRGDGASRAFVEKVVCVLLRLYFGVKVPDANAPFRLMRTDLLAAYMDRLPADYNLPNIMLTTYFVHDKRNVQFCEISFRPRQGGTNTINIRRIFKIGRQAMKDFRQLKKNMM